MPMKATDRIIAPSRGDAATALAYGRAGRCSHPDEVARYVQTVDALCRPADLPDASIVVAQSVHETTEEGRPWYSFWWRTRLNPAGMGITGDPAQNRASPTFATGAEAARAHVAHLLLYATGEVDRGGLTPADDPRYHAYVDAYGHTAQARTIQGLTGTWGVDPSYGAGVVRNGNAVYPALPNQRGGAPVPDVTFGKVPHPDYQNRPVPNSTAWNDLGPRTVRAVVWHRMLGSLWGTDGFFRGGAAALTDYGVGVAAQDGDDNDGVILRWNDPQGRRAPWANGVVSAPYGDGLKFVNRFGVDAVNRDATAIEISGHQTTPLTDKARDAICGITAYWADQAHVPWTEFPAVPGEDRGFVVWHQEFTIGTGKECPFTVVMDETEALLQRTRNILKRHQTGGPELPVRDYPAPIAYPWMAEDKRSGVPADHEENGVAIYALMRPYQALRATKRLRTAGASAAEVGPPIKKGERFVGWWFSRSKDGKRGFVWTPAGTRVDAGALTPRVSVREREQGGAP